MGQTKRPISSILFSVTSIVHRLRAVTRGVPPGRPALRHAPSEPVGVARAQRGEGRVLPGRGPGHEGAEGGGEGQPSLVHSPRLSVQRGGQGRRYLSSFNHDQFVVQ